MRWMQGRDRIDAMLAAGQVERVPPSREHADTMLTQARRHIALARSGVGTDPTGAYQLVYDASRKALASILENQGLRATSRGGHLAVLDVVTAQLDPRLGRRSAPSTGCAAVATALNIRVRTPRRSLPMTSYGTSSEPSSS